MKNFRNPSNPAPQRKEWAALWIVRIVKAIAVVIFFGRDIWHGEELKENRQAGNNVAEPLEGRTNY